MEKENKPLQLDLLGTLIKVLECIDKNEYNFDLSGRYFGKGNSEDLYTEIKEQISLAKGEYGVKYSQDEINVISAYHRRLRSHAYAADNHELVEKHSQAMIAIEENGFLKYISVCKELGLETYKQITKEIIGSPATHWKDLPKAMLDVKENSDKLRNLLSEDKSEGNKFTNDPEFEIRLEQYHKNLGAKHQDSLELLRQQQLVKLFKREGYKKYEIECQKFGIKPFTLFN